MSVPNSEFLDKLCAIAIEAGRRILKHYKKDSLAVIEKEDRSPLTAADMESHHYIVAQLKDLDKTIPIISEETSVPDYEVRKDWIRFWLVDPLDGTKEFLKANDEFTVNIALIEKKEPILGVIYVPAKDLLYYAAKGQGSWRKVGAASPSRLASSIPDPKKGLIVVESKSHPSPELESFLQDLTIRERICAGSSLKFCLVAEGVADIYPRMNPTMEWDVAAGDCIFRNSGVDGQRVSSLTYNKPSLKNDCFVIGFR